ncbi:MAG: MOSC domain-containing protein [Alphaproteobacteria bacterium]|nr:MOSC domain-containing protein [Alphaproteobacteria bacterium]
MKVESLHIYPVKGCRAVDVTEAALEQRGLAHDRRWMIVDENYKFATQREVPAMAAIETAIAGDMLALGLNGSAIGIDFPSPHAQKHTVTIWKQQVEAYAAGAAADKWVSQALGFRAHLVWQGGLPRTIASSQAEPDTPTSFADDFPVLVTLAESLADLNTRMAHPLPMNRFRPNIVISGAPAWSEDTWRKIRIRGTVIDLPKPCLRCAVTTTDQQLGLRSPDNEPLKTLKTFRLMREPGMTGVVFGQNGIPESTGVVHVGDTVEITQTQTTPALSGIG